MGFAAHLRYHWMENIFYKPLKTFGVMIIGGFEPEQAYIVHFAAIAIGHFNHSNIKITWGPLKYLLNNPNIAFKNTSKYASIRIMIYVNILFKKWQICNFCYIFYIHNLLF